ncbi:MAG: hypothetical protein U0175_23200 [Caldilineaceae bacterium]
MAINKQSTLLRLRSLSSHPQAQAELAATLLDRRNGMEVLLAVLPVLQKTPVDSARSGLIELYQHFEENGEKRDPSANLRAAILRALRSVVQPADLPLLQRAVTTYVFPPPDRKEEGALLRAAALHAIGELDELLAAYHAARLLVDEHNDPMSGEPALAAIRVLAAFSEPLPIYGYVTRPFDQLQAEVAAEALRNLTNIPLQLLEGLVARFGETPSGIILVGLFELLLNHRMGVQKLELLQRYLHEGRNLDALRYLAVIMLGSGNEQLIQVVLAESKLATAPERKKIFDEAVKPFAEMTAKQSS